MTLSATDFMNSKDLCEVSKKAASMECCYQLPS